MENRKIKNATRFSYDGIEFKSKLEVKCFIELRKAGFEPEYENLKLTIQDGFYPTVEYYKGDKKNKEGLKLMSSKVLPVTYTPDITFRHGAYTVLVEVKGFENDVYPLKQKVFRKWLEGSDEKYMFFEVKNVAQLQNMIKMIKR